MLQEIDIENKIVQISKYTKLSPIRIKCAVASSKCAVASSKCMS